MRLRSLAVAVAVIAAAAVCARLGFWQVSRLGQKRALNAEFRRTMSRPPAVVGDVRRLPDSLLHRPVAVRGTYDGRHHVLLSGMSHQGEPGVHVVTPLVAEGDSVAVLVDRGWLPAPDGVSARPQDAPALGGRGVRTVTGIADTLTRMPGMGALRPLEADSVIVYSAEELAWDSLAARLPYRLARFVVRELPSADAARLPVREAPEPYDESMHLIYAVQWFAFAVILLVGPATLARARRRR
jgi:surfeit locus 1 family protein